MDPVVALHPSLRLRRTGGNDANPQLLTHAPKLRHRNFSPQLLGLGRLSLVHVLPIGIERARHSILPNPHPQHFHCRPDGLFFAQTGLSCSWHRLPCPSGNPPDHALPANHGNSRPVAPVRQSATYAPCVGSVAGASVAGSTGLPPTSNAASYRDPSQSRLLRPSARPRASARIAPPPNRNIFSGLNSELGAE